jgi:hypothetical protein
MIKVVGLVLVIVGGILVYQGLSRKDSFMGQAAEVGTNVANKVDGGARLPKHMVSLVGGGALVLVGAVLVLRRGGS